MRVTKRSNQCKWSTEALSETSNTTSSTSTDQLIGINCYIDSYQSIIDKYQLATIVLSGFIAFIASIDGQFVFDDHRAIVENPAISQPNLIIFTDFWGSPIDTSLSHKSYRPVTILTFVLNYAISRLNPLSYHFVNIALHTIISVEVYEVLMELSIILDEQKSKKIAFNAAILFAVHPIHTEAVAGLVGRAELLMTFFTLKTLRLYVKAWKNVNFTQLNWWLIVILACLALFSKEQGIIAMPLCVAFDLIASKIDFRNLIKSDHHQMISSGSSNHAISNRSKSLDNRCLCRVLKCSLICLSLIFIRLSINNFESPKFSSNDNPIAFMGPIMHRLFNHWYMLVLYICKLAYPWNLCFDYSMGCFTLIQSITDPRMIICLVSIFVLAFIAFKFIYGTWRHSRLALFGISFGIISMIPSSNLLVTVGFIFAERILYLPSVSFCLLCSIVYNNNQLRRYLKNCDFLRKQFAQILLILMLGKCIQRSTEWRTELKLYESGLKVCPNNAKIHYNLGKIYSSYDDQLRAIISYKNALRLNPGYDQAMNNLANIHLTNGQNQAAELLFRQAIRIRPQFATAWMNLGISLVAQNRLKEAEESFGMALKFRKHYPDCLYNMGLMYLRLNRTSVAQSVWRNVTRLEPRHHRAWINLLILLNDLNKCADVLELVDEALSYHRDRPQVLSAIGTCFARLQLFQDAESLLIDAVMIDSENAAYWTNIGVLYERWGIQSKAQLAYQRANKIGTNRGEMKQQKNEKLPMNKSKH